MIELATVEAPLALFVEGIAGRYLHIKPDTAFTGNTTLSDFAAQSADTIYLPESLAGAEPASYRVLAMQQIAQRLYGSYQFRLALYLQALRDRSAPMPGDQTPPTSTLRLGELQRLRQFYQSPGLFQILFETLEQLRLDQLSVTALPGLRKHYLQHYEARLLSAPVRPLPDLLNLTLEHWLQQHSIWLSTSRAASEPFGSDSELDAMAQPLYQADASVFDSVSVANRAYLWLLAQLDQNTFASLSGGDALAERETSADWLERDARLTDWEEQEPGFETLLMNADLLDPEDVDAAAVEGLDGDIRPEDATLRNIMEQEAAPLDPDQEQRRADMERAALRHALGDDRADTRSYRYDEWHYTESRYLRKWCRLYEEMLEPDPELDGTDLGKRVRPWRDEIRRHLSLIKPLGYLRQRGVEDGDELDFNAVLESRLDAAAGLAPGERVYSRRDRVQRDLCAAFLIDLSASTDDPIEPPQPPPATDDDPEINLRDPFDVDFDNDAEAEQPPPRRIIDVQREAMVAMSAALESLGDEYGMFGFSGYGREAVEYYVAKEIGQPFTPQTLHSIAAMKPRRSTRMGPAIRHTTRKLLASGHAMKLLIMLSDGFPQDSDYGPVRGDHEYGVQDTAKALQEAERAGIRTFCITVDRSGHDYLARMCPSDQYLIIDEVEDLPGALGSVYERLAT
ncbi:MAG: nitric oxide reductase activation protein NorD [Pseudomonadales bacterium]